MEVLANEKKSLQLEKEELEELKEEMSEYKEVSWNWLGDGLFYVTYYNIFVQDVEDLKEVMEASGNVPATRITESKGARRLFKKVSSMIEQLDNVVTKLEKEEKAIKNTLSAMKTNEK